MYEIILSLDAEKNQGFVEPLLSVLNESNKNVIIYAPCKGGQEVHGELPIVVVPTGYVIRGESCSELTKRILEGDIRGIED